MSINRSPVVSAIEQRVTDLLNEKLDERYVYHDLKHTLPVRGACLHLADKAGLADPDREVLELGSRLHDAGFSERYEGHKEVSCLSHRARTAVASQLPAAMAPTSSPIALMASKS